LDEFARTNYLFLLKFTILNVSKKKKTNKQKNKNKNNKSFKYENISVLTK